jgi:hypothetical protein
MIERERKEELLRKLGKLEAYHQIQNEMGRTVAAFNFHQKDAVLSKFALDLADVSLEYADEGRFVGPKAVEAILEQILGGEAAPGEMMDMQLTTPIIEVADDLKTAKCVWWCPGAGAIAEDENPQAIWAWGQLAVDFILQAETWKIWHLHYFRLIRCSYEKGWVEDISRINRLNTAMHPLAEPTTYHNPYSPLSIREGLPCAPRPYRKYADADRFWELNRDKR